MIIRNNQNPSFRTHFRHWTHHSSHFYLNHNRPLNTVCISFKIQLISWTLNKMSPCITFQRTYLLIFLPHSIPTPYIFRNPQTIDHRFIISHQHDVNASLIPLLVFTVCFQLSFCLNYHCPPEKKQIIFLVKQDANSKVQFRIIRQCFLFSNHQSSMFHLTNQKISQERVL